MSGFEDSFNAAGRRSRYSAGRRQFARNKGLSQNAIASPTGCDCAKCLQSCNNPQAIASASSQPMTPVAAKMMAEQAAQVAADAAAKAAALNPTTGQVSPSVAAKTSAIDGFDNFIGKKLTKPQKIGTIVVAAALFCTAAYFTYKHFKKA